MYKLVKKIIQHRLRPLLYELISPYKTSFILGRNIQGNVIIVQEGMYLHQTRCRGSIQENTIGSKETLGGRGGGGNSARRLFIFFSKIRNRNVKRNTKTILFLLGL